MAKPVLFCLCLPVAAEETVTPLESLERFAALQKSPAAVVAANPELPAQTVFADLYRIDSARRDHARRHDVHQEELALLETAIQDLKRNLDKRRALYLNETGAARYGIEIPLPQRDLHLRSLFGKHDTDALQHIDSLKKPGA